MSLKGDQLALFLNTGETTNWGEGGYLQRYQADKKGVGLFALAVQKANPLLPFEDAGRLNDLVIRENFMVRLSVYRQWRLLNSEALTMGKLIKFYSPYKYQLMAHMSLMVQ